MPGRRATLLTGIFIAVCSGLAASASPQQAVPPPAEEFCLDGDFDLGARLQGTQPLAGEWYPSRMCVVTEAGSGRVRFVGSGRANPDMQGSFAVVYLPPDIVRIDNDGLAPDVEFVGKSIEFEAMRNRRLDPRRLVQELEAHPDWVARREADGAVAVRYPGSDFESLVRVEAGLLRRVDMWADLPLRGRVLVVWEWDWPEGGAAPPDARLLVDGTVIMRARGSRRTLPLAEAEAIWSPPDREAARRVPGDAWPARVAMQREDLASAAGAASRVTNVRTGFHHLVVDTAEGLIVVDAPAGWVELHQIPPSDLVPGLGISGLSERFVDFLAEHWPGRSLRAVAVTHAHDDHAGGARAFAAAGATVYAPSAVADFLAEALGRAAMPADRLAASQGAVQVLPVAEPMPLGDASSPVILLPIEASPHVEAALGVWLPGSKLFFQSDLHVPNSEADEPRSERRLSECWFADWAVRNLPADTVVLNSHSTVGTPVERLGRYLDSEACRSGGHLAADKSK